MSANSRRQFFAGSIVNMLSGRNPTRSMFASIRDFPPWNNCLIVRTSVDIVSVHLARRDTPRLALGRCPGCRIQTAAVRGLRHFSLAILCECIALTVVAAPLFAEDANPRTTIRLPLRSPEVSASRSILVPQNPESFRVFSNAAIWLFLWGEQGPPLGLLEAAGHAMSPN